MKKIMTKILLAVLPVLAVVLATTGDSVKIINRTTGEIAAASYFELLPEGTLQMAPHLAGICAAVTVLLIVVFLVNKNQKMLKGAKWCSFTGALFAVLPMFVKEGETLMLPNVGVPLFLMIEFFVCSMAEKMDLRSDKELNGPRLERHI